MRNTIYLVLYYINEALLTSDADGCLSACTEYVCVYLEKVKVRMVPLWD